MSKEIRVLYPDVLDNTGTAFLMKSEFNGNKSIEYIIPSIYIDMLHISQSRGDFLPEGAMEFLDFLSKKHKEGESLSTSIKIEDGLTIRILTDEKHNIDQSYKISSIDKELDNHIIGLLKKIKEKNPDSKLHIVSQNKATRAFYRLRGFKALDFDFDPWDTGIVGEGVLSIDQYNEDKLRRIFSEQFSVATVPSLEEILGVTLKPNQFLKKYSSDNIGYNYLKVIRNPKGERHLESFNIIDYLNNSVQGIFPRTHEQALLFNLMKSCDVIGVHGVAGSGKTILALAYLTEMVERGYLDRVIITKPIVSIGQPIGFTKGDKIMKLRQWFGNFLDNISKLDIYGSFGGRIPNLIYDPWGELRDLRDKPVKNARIRDGIYELESLEFMRGRNLGKVGVMIDESQNLKPEELQAIISRMDKGSKYIILGDIRQVDRQIPGFGIKYNGYLAFVKAYWGENYVGILDFTETQRHEAAKQAFKIPTKQFSSL